VSTMGFRRPPSMVSTFEAYLRTENFLSAEDHSKLLLYLRSPLPTSFRIRSEAVHRDWLRMMQQGKSDLGAVPLKGIERGWKLNKDASEEPWVRKWLSGETKKGRVSRQEYVSMLPVLLLDIEPHHVVLDMYASPGSKTTQAVDALYRLHDGEDITSDASLEPPEGLCIANELDAKRAYVLAARCKLLGQRCASLAVACHNATKFPNVNAPLVSSSRSSKDVASRGSYDRIICDVPCSGDGTLRKDVKVWRTWHPSYGMALHPLQLRIAKRGIALLKIGGIMTYSTCSFHPLENEAVVSALLETGCVEILPPTKLDQAGIIYRPGLQHWMVLDDDLNEVTCEEVTCGPKKNRLGKNKAPLPKSLWPPEQKRIQEDLTRCVRMVPHDNDTGGFFIAVLRKIRNFPMSSKQNGNPLVVTPKAAHHELHLVDDRASNESSSESPYIHYKRGPTGSRIFALTPSLSQHVHQSIGSAKLNLVYSGWEETSSTGKAEKNATTNT